MVLGTEVIALSYAFEACSLVASHEQHVAVFPLDFALAVEQRFALFVLRGTPCATCRSEGGGYGNEFMVKPHI